MNRVFPYIIIVIAFLFSSFLCFSQTDVAVKATIDRDKIMIGEPIELKLEARLPVGEAAAWFPVDSMAHFELIDKGKIDTSAGGSSTIYRQTLTITSFDSGRWAVPALAFTIGNKDYLTDSLAVSVAYSNFDPKQDYHDIKEIIEIDNTSVRYINWVLMAVAALSLLALIYFLSKKSDAPKPVAVKKTTANLSPLQEALEAIAALQKKGYAGQGGIKVFHTQLNDIFRQYLYRKTSRATMEKTSGELMLQVKQLNLPAGDFVPLAQALRMNDAVKFAKYQPDEPENEQALETIKKAVTQLDTVIS